MIKHVATFSHTCLKKIFIEVIIDFNYGDKNIYSRVTKLKFGNKKTMIDISCIFYL